MEKATERGDSRVGTGSETSCPSENQRDSPAAPQRAGHILQGHGSPSR